MKQATKVPRPVFTAEERARWVWRFRSSDLPQAQFAQRHGLKLTTLQKWLYGRGSRPAPRRKPPVRAEGDTSHRSGRTAAVFHREPRRAPAATFREITVPPLLTVGVWAAEVSWPSGVAVRFGAGAAASWIGALLAAVRRAC